MSTTNSSEPRIAKVPGYDLVEMAIRLSAALEVDCPQEPAEYANAARNILWAYLTKDERDEVDEYITSKAYRTDPNAKLIIT